MEKDLNQLLKKWLEGKLQQHEIDQHPVLKSLEKIINRTAQYRPPSQTTPEQAWEAVEKRSIAKPFFLLFLRRRSMPIITAACLLLIGIAWLLPSNQQQIFTAAGEQQLVTLPDGSKVHLNADSRLSYQQKHWPTQRQVTLDGEAFFDIAQGGVFTIETLHGSAKTLGSHFNLYSRTGKFQLDCRMGKVLLSSNTRGRNGYLEVVAGNSVSLKENGSFTPAYPHESETIGSWIEGKYYFDHTPLAEVLKSIERLYGVHIHTDGELSGFYTGIIKDDNLEYAMELLCASTDTDYHYDAEANMVEVFPIKE